MISVDKTPVYWDIEVLQNVNKNIEFYVNQCINE